MGCTHAHAHEGVLSGCVHSSNVNVCTSLSPTPRLGISNKLPGGAGAAGQDRTGSSQVLKHCPMFGVAFTWQASEARFPPQSPCSGGEDRT